MGCLDGGGQVDAAVQEVAGRTVFEPIGDESACVAWLWRTLYAPDGSSAVCRHCRTMRRFHRVTRRRAYACDRCGSQIYPAAGTFMGDSGLPIASWFRAVTLILYDDRDLGPRRLSEDLRVGYRTALRMKKLIEKATTSGGSDAILLEELGRIASTGEPARLPFPAQSGRAAKARDNIRAAACRAFAEGGLAGTRIADIAREAGVSSAIIHYYFKSKDEVLLAAIEWSDDQAHRRLQRLFLDTDDHIERLRRLVDEAVPQTETLRQEYLLWLEAWPRTRRHPEVLASCVAMSNRWSEFVAAVVEGGVAAGTFVPQAPVEEIVSRITAIADGFAYRSVVGYEMMRVHRARQLLASFVAEQLGVPPQALARQSGVSSRLVSQRGFAPTVQLGSRKCL